MNEKDFALRLSKLRTEKNVSAREMSLSIWQNPNYINNIENEKSTPSLPCVFYICEYLGITPAEFFDTDSPNPERLNNIIKYLKKLDKEQLEIIEKLVKNMTENKWPHG